MTFPVFPDDPLASAVHDAYPPIDDIAQWSTDQLRELAVWNAAALAENLAVEDVIGLTDDPPHMEFPEHSVTPDDELDRPFDGSL